MLLCAGLSAWAVSAAPSAAASAGQPYPADRVLAVAVDGRIRRFLVHLPPAYDAVRKLPVVIILHGGGGDYRYAQKMTGMSEKADAEGFIAVYPNGSGRIPDRFLTWNAGDCCGYAVSRQVDDVGFIERLIHELDGRLAVDSSRIYLTGMSNGAMMAYLVACRLSEKIAAVACVAGSMSGKEPAPGAAVPLMIVHGTGDRHVPYEGGKGKLARWGYAVNDRSVSYAVSFWVEHNGCAAAASVEERGPLHVERFGGGREGSEVVLFRIDGGRHAWPGGKKAWAGADAPYAGLKATDEIWRFFSRHARRGPL